MFKYFFKKKKTDVYEKVVTLAVTEIKNISQMSEKESQKIINELYNFIDIQVNKYSGKVYLNEDNKIYSIWGYSNNSSNNHAELACQCVLNYKEFLNEFKSSLEIYTGIHTDELIINPDEDNFTVLGDGEVYTKKICEIVMNLGKRILISQKTKYYLSITKYRQINEILNHHTGPLKLYDIE